MPLKAQLPIPDLPAVRSSFGAAVIGSRAGWMALSIMPPSSSDVLELVGLALRQAHDDNGKDQGNQQHNDADRRGIPPATAVERLVVEVKRGHFGSPAGTNPAAGHDLHDHEDIERDDPEVDDRGAERLP